MWTILNNFIQWYEENKGRMTDAHLKAEQIMKLTTLLTHAVRAKMDSIYDFLDEYQTSQTKIVVFAHHKITQEQIFNRYTDNAVWFRASMTPEQQRAAENKFNTDENCLFAVVSFMSGKEGLNLQVAQHLAFAEYIWTPGDHLQAEDRIHRIGQKGCASIYYLVAEDTIEEYLEDVLAGKRKILDGMFDSTYDYSVNTFTDDVIRKFWDKKRGGK